MAEQEAWDRNRAAIVPATMVLAFFYLNGFIDSDDQGIQYLKIGLFSMIPGGFIGLIILMKTKRSNGPEFLMTIYAILSFLMSVVWINFTSNCIMDLLQLFGFITKLPRALFGLTILAWGNCLGDMSADVAMTIKGFGEMAITGTMAGPIFNILVG
jgi:sodium/potassium/calcium exchanger 6